MEVERVSRIGEFFNEGINAINDDTWHGDYQAKIIQWLEVRP
jgi:hypothetical protein